MTEKKEIVKIDAAEYGMDEQKASQIKEQFTPMLDKMVELENEFNEIVSMEISPEVCEKAKQLRLKYVKIRTGTAEIHKKQKAFYLAAGRFIDGWKNAQLFASEGIESRLKTIENHYELIKQQEQEQLKQKRIEELKPYGIDSNLVNQLNLGEMPEDVWNSFLVGTKTTHEQKIAAEQKAEQDRLETERKQKLYNDRRFELQKYGMLATTEDQISIDTTDEEFTTILNRLICRKNEQEEKRAEEERIKQLQQSRYNQMKHLATVCGDIDFMNLHSISEEEFQQLLNSKTAIFAEEENKKKELAQKEKDEAAAKQKQADEEERKRTAPDKEKLTELYINLEMYKLPEVEDEKMKAIVDDVRKLLDRVADHIKTKLKSK